MAAIRTERSGGKGETRKVVVKGVGDSFAVVDGSPLVEGKIEIHPVLSELIYSVDINPYRYSNPYVAKSPYT